MIVYHRLFDQADALIQGYRRSRREEDLRRAVSATYYALFHQCLAEAAKLFLRPDERSGDLYALPYRAIAHKQLKALCEAYIRPRGKYAAHLDAIHVDPGMIAYAEAFVDLHELRTLADYDPDQTFSPNEAATALKTARSAAARFRNADRAKRRRFLILLHFPPR